MRRQGAGHREGADLASVTDFCFRRCGIPPFSADPAGGFTDQILTAACSNLGLTPPSPTVPAAWEEPVETIIPTTFKPFIRGAMAKRDQLERDRSCQEITIICHTVVDYHHDSRRANPPMPACIAFPSDALQSMPTSSK
jgi:hypothetical protein